MLTWRAKEIYASNERRRSGHGEERLLNIWSRSRRKTYLQEALAESAIDGFFANLPPCVVGWKQRKELIIGLVCLEYRFDRLFEEKLAQVFQAFDRWMAEKHPHVPFERYADDTIVHCRKEAQAQEIRTAIAARLKECGLELHPEKTKVVYCKDD